MTATYDVLIVGAGPTGLTLAARLQEFGVRARIVDRQLDRVHESRALAMQPRTLEVLRGLGFAQTLVERGNDAVQLRMHFGQRTVPMRLFDIGLEATAYPFLLFISQSETEAILNQHLEAHGITVERGVELLAFRAGTDEIGCTLCRDDGTTEEVRTRYLIGCDGAHSTVHNRLAPWFATRIGRLRAVSVVVVTGGTGALGKHAVRVLAERGHELRVASRRTGVDLASGAGLDDATNGADLVLHAATDTRRLGAGDPKQTRNLLAACGQVHHLLYVSIVGIDAIPYRYYRRKLECERLIEESSVPHTILRATQFHELIDRVLTAVGRWPLVPLPLSAKGQPVAAAEVAARCADLLEGEALARAPDFGGPEILTLRQLLELWPGRIRALPLPVIGRILRGFRAGLNTTPEHADGVQTWAQYVEAR